MMLSDKLKEINKFKIKLVLNKNIMNSHRDSVMHPYGYFIFHVCSLAILNELIHASLAEHENFTLS